MSLPPAYRDEFAEKEFNRIYELDPFGIPGFEALIKDENTLWAVKYEIERAFLIGFMEGKKSK